MLPRGLKFLFTFFPHYTAIKKFSGLSDEKKNASSWPDKFVADLVSFGPLFIKLGQILSTRPDILPRQYISRLEKLHENVPAFKFNRAQKIVEEELGRPIDAVFRSIEEKPVASASLAQVHFAILHSGEEVALKIQRPEVKRLIERDFRLLGKILRLLKFLYPRMIKGSNIEEGFREFRRYTLQELNFAHEANTIERFTSNFREWDDIIFPTIYWDYTTSRMLTMERLSGMRLNEALSRLSKEEKEHLNTRLAEMELKMFISDGLFHADLHPGNIFFREDGKIVLLDFGMYGELNEEERNRFVLYWMAVSQNQVNRAFYHFRMQCKELPGANEKGFF